MPEETHDEGSRGPNQGFLIQRSVPFSLKSKRIGKGMCGKGKESQ